MPPKTIFITGAASGIGRATALLFHGHGWFVGCADVDEPGLETLAEELGERCFTARLDVTDKAAFDAVMAEFTAATEHRLDIMFNNAGITFGGNFDDVPFEKTLQIVDVNLTGVLNGIHAAFPFLRSTPNSLCFSTSSSAATFGSPGMATYAATKYAVKGLTEALSVELARYDSRAAAVFPGIIDTGIWRSGRYVGGEVVSDFSKVPAANTGRDDASRTLGPEAVADSVWEAYHGDRVHYFVPPELVDRVRATAESPETLRDELIARWR